MRWPSLRPAARYASSTTSRARRTCSGVVPAVRIVPSASSPDSRSVRALTAPTKTGDAADTAVGGQSRATSSRRTYRPSTVSRSPRSSARSATRYSRSSVIGDSTRAPTWAIQSWTPCPMPRFSRPGNSRNSVAVSIAVIATLRSGTGSRPTPIRRRLVQARAAAAAAMPLSKKQSSHSQSSSRPASSAASATLRSRSGANCGRNTTPRFVMPPILAHPPPLRARRPPLRARRPPVRQSRAWTNAYWPLVRQVGTSASSAATVPGSTPTTTSDFSVRSATTGAGRYATADPNGAPSGHR